MAGENERIRALRDRLLAGLQAIPEVIVNGHLEARVPHNLNISFRFVEGESLLMGMKGIAVSSGSACTSASLEPSYVLRALGLSDEVAHSSIRFSVGRFSTEADIDAAASATLQYPSGAIAVISSTCVVHYPCRIGLWLYAEDLVVECREFSLRVERPQGTETSEPTVDPFLAEDRAFIHALRTGDRSAIRVPYAEALRTHRLVMRVVEAAQS